MNPLEPLLILTKKMVLLYLYSSTLDMKATITIGKTKKKPTDYLEGEIIY